MTRDQEKSRHSFIDAADTRACEAAGCEPVRRPYRQVPRDFAERWPQFGWGGAKEEWRAHSRTIQRWVEECGKERMVLARKAYLDAQRAVASRARRKRYVMGQTLTPANRQSPILLTEGHENQQDRASMGSGSDHGTHHAPTKVKEAAR